MKVAYVQLCISIFLFLPNFAHAQVSGGLPPIGQQPKVSTNNAIRNVQDSPFRPYAFFEKKYGTDGVHKYIQQFNYEFAEQCRSLSNREDVDGLFCLYVINRRSGYDDKAFPFVKRAAELGNPVAMWELKFAYGKGVGTPQNTKQEAYWLQKCIDARYARCELSLGWIYMDMDNKSQYPIDYAEAMRLNLLAYEHGHAEGASNVGMLYEKGWGVPINYPKAVAFYKNAISGKGSSGQAETRLAYMYQSGLGVMKDVDEAKRLYKLVFDRVTFKDEYKKIAKENLDKLN